MPASIHRRGRGTLGGVAAPGAVRLGAGQRPPSKSSSDSGSDSHSEEPSYSATDAGCFLFRLRTAPHWGRRRIPPRLGASAAAVILSSIALTSFTRATRFPPSALHTALWRAFQSAFWHAGEQYSKQPLHMRTCRSISSVTKQPRASLSIHRRLWQVQPKSSDAGAIIAETSSTTGTGDHGTSGSRN
jgi:hypothetical protein